MPIRRMYHRRAIRPDGSFHRDKRRRRLYAPGILERDGNSKLAGFAHWVKKVMDTVLRRRS